MAGPAGGQADVLPCTHFPGDRHRKDHQPKARRGMGYRILPHRHPGAVLQVLLNKKGGELLRKSQDRTGNHPYRNPGAIPVLQLRETRKVPAADTAYAGCGRLHDDRMHVPRIPVTLLQGHPKPSLRKLADAPEFPVRTARDMDRVDA